MRAEQTESSAKKKQAGTAKEMKVGKGTKEGGTQEMR